MSRALAGRQALLAEVRHLGSQLVAGEASLLQYRQGLCNAFLQHFVCSRASLWRFIGAGPSRRLRCFGLSTAASGFEQPGTELDVGAYAMYVEHLASSGTFAASDVRSDPKLQELSAYFDATGVCSLMDSAFQFNGELFGTICIEQVDQPRDWTAQEVAALREAVVLVSLAIARMGPRFDFSRDDATLGDDGDAWC